jgi:hypothetical protein
MKKTDCQFGAKVKVIANESDHNFELGTVVKISSTVKEESDEDNIKLYCQCRTLDDKEWWSIYLTDLELYSEK